MISIVPPISGNIEHCQTNQSQQSSHPSPTSYYFHYTTNMKATVLAFGALGLSANKGSDPSTAAIWAMAMRLQLRECGLSKI